MIRFLAVLSMLVAVAHPAMGNPYCNVCRQRVVVPVVHKEVKVVKQQLAVFKIYPTYAATFIPPAPLIIQQGSAAVGQQSYNVTTQQGYGVQLQGGVGIQQQVAGNDFAAILARIDARLAAVEEKCAITANGNGGAFGVKTPKGMPKALATKCAACHNATVADKDGGGFVMFDKGAMENFSALQLLKISTKLSTQAMPPPNNVQKIPALTETEYSEVVQWLDSQK